MNEPYFDGDFLPATQHGPIVPSIDPNSGGRIWTQPMVHRASLWTPLELDTPGPLVGDPPEPAGVLIEETVPQLEVGEVVTWNRIFADTPDTLVLPARFAHSYQFVDFAARKINEVTLGTAGRVMHEYFLAPDPTTIPMLFAFRFYIDNNGFVSATGDASVAERPPGTTGWIITADCEIERYRGAGNIWCRKTPYVPPRSGSVVLS